MELEACFTGGYESKPHWCLFHVIVLSVCASPKKQDTQICL